MRLYPSVTLREHLVDVYSYLILDKTLQGAFSWLHSADGEGKTQRIQLYLARTMEPVSGRARFNLLRLPCSVPLQADDKREAGERSISDHVLNAVPLEVV